MKPYDLDARVPPRGVPEPEWVTREAFERQLELVHRVVPDDGVGLFGPDSMMWRVSRFALPGSIGAGRALLLQIAHPWVTQGVDHHSETRDDPIGRAHRTFTAVLSMVYGSRAQALEYARIVRRRHDVVHGRMDYDAGGFPQGSSYRANEVNAMVWVHATLWETSIRMYELVVGALTDAEKERYYQETKLFAYLFGIPEEALPPDWPTFLAYNERVWESDQLRVTPATRELTKFLFEPLHPALAPAMAWLELATAATLPPRLARDFGLAYGPKQRVAFEASVRALRLANRFAPDRVRMTPTYFEALDRLAGRAPDRITRLLTRATLGRSKLVA